MCLNEINFGKTEKRIRWANQVRDFEVTAHFNRLNPAQKHYDLVNSFTA